MNKYKRLNIEEREQISRSLAADKSFREIAGLLSRSVSTISREVNRFRLGRVGYLAVINNRDALYQSSSRRKRKLKIRDGSELSNFIREKLNLCWSPRQIAEYLKIHYDKDMQVSAETIYTYIYVFARKTLRQEMIKSLRRSHKKRRVKGAVRVSRAAKLDDMVSIDERPAEVAERLIPGHWEGDLMIGGAKEQTALGTLVERTTRYAILVPLQGKSAEEVRTEFSKEIKKLPSTLRLSLTYDQGREMAQHKLFTKETKMKVYFAHPRSPWERGTNENTNGLIRQFFPKGTNFKQLNRNQVKRVQKLLNERPRQTLGWKTPAEAMAELLR
jgi:IS30 family transposase